MVEQHCPYPELDGQDPQAHHLSAWARDGQLWAYLRVLPPTERYPSPSIGRVLTTAAARGLGLGRELMRRGIAACQQCYPGQDILLGAQQHLEPFYASLGFVSNGHRYVEDGIPHVDMRLMATANSPQ
ncbi:MAG: GNAT family N-acetyltransferase [Wenzhouxiangellaceae bacterium]